MECEVDHKNKLNLSKYTSGQIWHFVTQDLMRRASVQTYDITLHVIVSRICSDIAHILSFTYGKHVGRFWDSLSYYQYSQ